MPDPISSSSVSSDLTCVDPSSEPNACVPPAPAPTVCAAPSPPSAAEANAAAELATAYLRTDHSAFLEASKAPGTPTSPTPETDNNAYRTTIRHDNGSYSAIGFTEDKQSVFVAHALHKSDDEHGTLEIASEYDGSHGCNAGAAATAIGLEATVEYSGWSFTFGEALSMGGGFSSGEARDIDGDGSPERCFKGSLGPYTVGFCTEL